MSDKNTNLNPVVHISGRLSYPNLFRPRVDKSDEGKDKIPKYEATLILDKKVNAADILKIQAAIRTCRADPIMKGRPPNKICLRDGADTPARAEAEGYGPNVMSIGARNKTRPAVVGRRKEQLTEEDGIIFPGCYVNATMEIYPFVHSKSGPIVAASLRAVQFVRKGDPLGEATVDPQKEFKDLGDEDGSNVDSDNGADSV